MKYVNKILSFGLLVVFVLVAVSLQANNSVQAASQEAIAACTAIQAEQGGSLLNEEEEAAELLTCAETYDFANENSDEEITCVINGANLELGIAICSEDIEDGNSFRCTINYPDFGLNQQIFCGNGNEEDNYTCRLNIETQSCLQDSGIPNDQDNDGIPDNEDDDIDGDGVDNDEDADEASTDHCQSVISGQNYVPGTEIYESLVAQCKNQQQISGGENSRCELDESNLGGAGTSVFECRVPNKCQGVNFIISWVVCPIIQAIDEFITNALDNVLEKLLTFNLETGEGLGNTSVAPPEGVGGALGAAVGDIIQDELGIESDGPEEGSEAGDLLEDLKDMWTNMRNITNAIFIILFVIAIFGHVTGAIEAYTAKKIIPRIVIAAILTQLSWFISVELSAIFDDFGKGIGDLIEMELLDEDDNGMISEDEDVTLQSIIGGDADKAGAAGFLSLVGGAAGLYVGAFTILPFALAAAFAILLGLLTLLVRRIVLIVLVILSPIALTMWALPATEKWSRQWFSWYIRLLMAYPFIEMLIVIGKVSAKVISEDDSGMGRSWIFIIAGVLMFLAPYALLPLTIKLATSTIGFITGFANDKSKGIIDKTSNWARENQKGLRQSRQSAATVKYATTTKPKLRDLGSKAGLKNIARRAKYRAGSGRAAPTALNRRIREDAADQAREQQNQIEAVRHRRQLAEARNSAAESQDIDAQVRAFIRDVNDKKKFSKPLNEEEEELIELGDGAEAQELARSMIHELKEKKVSSTELMNRGYAAYNGTNPIDLDGVERDINEQILSGRVGDKIDINGKATEITAALQNAAVSDNISRFGDSDDAIEAVDNFFTQDNGGDFGQTDSIQQALRQNKEALLQVAPQIVYGTDKFLKDVYSQQHAQAMPNGANKNLLKRIQQEGGEKQKALMNAYTTQMLNMASSGVGSGRVAAQNMADFMETAKHIYEVDEYAKLAQIFRDGESGGFKESNFSVRQEMVSQIVNDFASEGL